MVYPNIKRAAVCVALPLLLNACAGGGNVREPDVVVNIPVLQSADVSGKTEEAARQYATIATGSEGVKGSVRVYGTSFYDKEVAYRTPDGKYYLFNSFNTAMIPSYSALDKTFPQTQKMQPTDNGGKIFACCTDTGGYYPAVNLRDSYFGAWMSKDGQTSLFSAGKLADVQKMQSIKEGDKGKAVYEVVGFRVKNGEMASSAYRPKSLWTDDVKPLVSELTVDFNTGNISGTIQGNQAFGDSLTFKRVQVNGNKFSGSAVSDGQTGQVDGAFYGDAREWWGEISEYAGKEIGGVVKFGAGKEGLDTVFGGTRTKP